MAGTGVTFKNWKWPNIQGQLRREVTGRLRKAGEVVASQIRQNVSISTRANGPSQPGNFFHSDTGTARKSVTYEVDETTLVARVGSNLEYFPHLELGTSKMQPRPSIVPTLDQCRLRLRAIFKKPMK